MLRLTFITVLVLATATSLRAEDEKFTPLFPDDGVPKGWVVRA